MRHLRHVKIAGAVAAVAVATGAVSLGFGIGGQSASPARAAAAPATAPVIRTDVSSRQQVAGVLGYPPAPTLVAQQAAATITQLPAVGAVIQRGGILYEADGQPVLLLYGAHAAWRTLELGINDGQDVLQLKRNLIALGYASPASLTADDDFDAATVTAIEHWQIAQGLPVTGVLSLGTIAFLPGAARVSATLALVGAPIQPGTPVLALTSPELTVSVALDPTLRQLVHRGDRVSIQLPAGNQTTGRVAHVAADVSTTSPGQASAGAATPKDPPLPARAARARPSRPSH